MGVSKCIGKDKKVYNFFSVMNINWKPFTYYIGQLFLLLLLFRKDVNDGEKELFKEQKWKGIDAAIVILSGNALTFFLYMLFSMESLKFIYRQLFQLVLQKNQVIFYTLIYDSLLSIILVAIIKFGFKQNMSVLGIKRKDLRKNIELGLAFALIFSFVYLIFSLSRETNKLEIEVIKRINNLNNILDYSLYFFLIVILGPIVEEITYRGILYSPYRKKYGATVAIIITSIFFSIAHTKSPTVSVVIIGIFLGMLYERTESLISTIVAHSTYNLVNTVGIYYLYNYY